MSRRNGKRDHGGAFVQLHHWIVDSPAYSALTPNARCVYVAVKRRFNGTNNGLISFSARQAGDAIGASHHTGNRALNELVSAGFLEITEFSNFDRKVRLARTYLLTEAPDDRPGLSRIAKKTFMRPAANSKHSLMGAADSRMGETAAPKPPSKRASQSHQRDCEPPAPSVDSRMDATHLHSSHTTGAAQTLARQASLHTARARAGETAARSASSTDGAPLQIGDALLNSPIIQSVRAASARRGAA